MSANELVTGWWEGRQLGLIKFLAGNGRGNGVAYSCDWLFLRGWGFDFEATPYLYFSPSYLTAIDI